MPALTKYGDDRKAYAVSPDRDTYRRVTCDFVASGSGSYYSRSCQNLAQWAEGYDDGEGGVRLPSVGNYVAKRCHRHRAIDERTQANRGWATSRRYARWDGEQKAHDIDALHVAQAEAKRLDTINENVATYAAYILKHVELPSWQREAVDLIAKDAKGNVLTVR